MTATNIVCQPLHKCLHVVTDGATYTPDGIVRGIGPKVFTVPSWPGVVTGRGSGVVVMALAQELSLRFQSFDALVAGIEDELPRMVTMFGFGKTVELIVAGYSAERAAPECYVITTGDELGRGVTAEAAATRTDAVLPAAFTLAKLPNVVAAPIPTLDIMMASGFDGIDEEAEPTDVIARLGRLIECQRHDDPTGDGVHFVGGFVQITSIGTAGIVQAILSRWEDKIGRVIVPGRPSWVAAA